MATLDFSNYSIYRWRYIIGYSIIGLLLTGVFVFIGFFLPGGLSTQEMASAVQSASLSFSDPATLAIPNLPYYALQSLIFTLFGISIFTIKLPSLILAMLSAVGFILLLRRWFKPNIAVLASLIAITTGQFLFIAQQGTPEILYLFWPIVLLLLGTQITRVHKARFLWKILFAISAALSLYTPLSIYPLVAIALATVLHPHLRNAVRRLSKPRLVAVTILFLLLIAPLVYGIVLNPQLGLTLLGVPATWPPDLVTNIQTVVWQYFVFWEPNVGTLMTPVFGLGSAILILLGAYRIIRTRETTRSYLIIIWIICLTPVLLFNPTFTSVTFVPSMLLLAAGLTSLIGYWYRLFPFNPYARITGLIPLIILVFALSISGLARYVYGYHYSPNQASLFSKDLALLPKDTRELIVSNDERAFYTAVAKYRDDLKIVELPSGNTFVMTRTARTNFDNYQIYRIITNGYTNESDRLYVYKKIDL
ncbi:MAG: glycosyltransferase family 39 protein [Candidatus Microsaccharimonas sp.]